MQDLKKKSNISNVKKNQLPLTVAIYIQLTVGLDNQSTHISGSDRLIYGKIFIDYLLKFYTI